MVDQHNLITEHRNSCAKLLPGILREQTLWKQLFHSGFSASTVMGTWTGLINTNQSTNPHSLFYRGKGTDASGMPVLQKPSTLCHIPLRLKRKIMFPFDFPGDPVVLCLREGLGESDELLRLRRLADWNRLYNGFSSARCPTWIQTSKILIRGWDLDGGNSTNSLSVTKKGHTIP